MKTSGEPEKFAKTTGRSTSALEFASRLTAQARSCFAHTDDYAPEAAGRATAVVLPALCARPGAHASGRDARA